MPSSPTPGGHDEVSYQHIQQRELAEQHQGFAKIEGCARLAASRGLKWVWIDTCCIEKTSSSELSEAINSMYAWCRDAVMCYVYLADVSGLTNGMLCDFYERLDKGLAAGKDIAKSRWFTRGWALQELIAPRLGCYCSYPMLRVSRMRPCRERRYLSGLRPRRCRGRRYVSPPERKIWPTVSWVSSTYTCHYCTGRGPVPYASPGEDSEALRGPLTSGLDIASLEICLRPGVFTDHPRAFNGQQFQEVSIDNDEPEARKSVNASLKAINVRRGSRYPPSAVTNRGILATLLVIPTMFDSEHRLFAWIFATTMFEVEQRDDEVMSSQLGRRLSKPKPTMSLVGLDLEIDIDVLAGDGLSDVLKRDHRPLVTRRCMGTRLLCLDAREEQRLIPHQFYLSLGDQLLEPGAAGCL